MLIVVVGSSGLHQVQGVIDANRPRFCGRSVSRRRRTSRCSCPGTARPPPRSRRTWWWPPTRRPGSPYWLSATIPSRSPWWRRPCRPARRPTQTPVRSSAGSARRVPDPAAWSGTRGPGGCGSRSPPPGSCWPAPWVRRATSARSAPTRPWSPRAPARRSGPHEDVYVAGSSPARLHAQLGTDVRTVPVELAAGQPYASRFAVAADRAGRAHHDARRRRALLLLRRRPAGWRLCLLRTDQPDRRRWSGPPAVSCTASARTPGKSDESAPAPGRAADGALRDRGRTGLRRRLQLRRQRQQPGRTDGHRLPGDQGPAGLHHLVQ